MIIRIGDGQTPSGKILDKNTHYYLYLKNGNTRCDRKRIL